jgi:hypothetical protein
MTNSAVASATYTVQQQKFTLTVSKTDLGIGPVTSSPAGINCGSTCSTSYISGTTVTLTATPGLLSGFGGWSGCYSVSGNICTVDMNSARSVTTSHSSGSSSHRPIGVALWRFLAREPAQLGADCTQASETNEEVTKKTPMISPSN